MTDQRRPSRFGKASHDAVPPAEADPADDRIFLRGVSSAVGAELLGPGRRRGRLDGGSLAPMRRSGPFRRTSCAVRARWVFDAEAKEGLTLDDVRQLTSLGPSRHRPCPIVEKPEGHARFGGGRVGLRTLHRRARCRRRLRLLSGSLYPDGQGLHAQKDLRGSLAPDHGRPRPGQVWRTDTSGDLHPRRRAVAKAGWATKRRRCRISVGLAPSTFST